MCVRRGLPEQDNVSTLKTGLAAAARRLTAVREKRRCRQVASRQADFALLLVCEGGLDLLATKDYVGQGFRQQVSKLADTLYSNADQSRTLQCLENRWPELRIEHRKFDPNFRKQTLPNSTFNWSWKDLHSRFSSVLRL